MQQKQHLIGAGINRSFLFLLINAHVVIIVILLYIIVRQSIKLGIECHHEVPGSVFKRNLLFAFTFFSVIPSFFIFFTAGKFITTSIDDWFHGRISHGLESGLNLHKAQTAHLRYSLKKIGDALVNAYATTQKIMALPHEYSLYMWSIHETGIIGSPAEEIHVWRSYRTLNDRSMQSLKSAFFSELNLLQNNTSMVFDFYGSLYYAKKIDDTYVIVVRRYPESIRQPLLEIHNALADYYQLKSMRNPIYLSYIFTFILVTLLIIFLSIWCAFYLSRGISTPIQALLNAMEKLRNGEWNVQVPYNPSSDLKSLALGFNEMSKALKNATYELDRKNKEMMTILENIKASVFFITKFGRISTCNRAAKELVANYLNINRFKNKRITFLGTEVSATCIQLARTLKQSEKNFISQEVTFSFKGELRTLMIHMTALLTHDPLKQIDPGLLVVIEDLSEIVKMSKIKTWQEAAKQVAHEIKNPLTPIQLACQRLQRRYKDLLNQDPIFIECTNTILNHVKIIKDLSSHFSEFAAMPAPCIEEINLREIIQEIVSLYALSYPEIQFVCPFKEIPELIKSDKQKMKRVFINLLDNSIRALNSSQNQKKCISIITKKNEQTVEILIADNGPGIERSVKDKLFLPYVSSSKKNMGLGLSIVHDIISQLGGSIILVPTNQGATFQIILPL